MTCGSIIEIKRANVRKEELCDMPKRPPPPNGSSQEEWDKWFSENLKEIGRENHDLFVRLGNRGKGRRRK
jgi:hypothetical protein